MCRRAGRPAATLVGVRKPTGKTKNPRYTDPRIAFGQRLLYLRLKSRLSQEELGELANLHRNYVGGVERGERNVALLNIVQLARALHVRPRTLLDWLH